MSEKSHVGMFNCFFCGEVAGILLDKRMKDSLPQNVGVINMDPCNKCEEWMKKGIIIIEVEDNSFDEVEKAQKAYKIEWDLASDYERKKMAPFIPNPPRTGQMWVIRQEALEKAITNKEQVERILKCRWTFLEKTVADQMGLPREEKAEPFQNHKRRP